MSFLRVLGTDARSLKTVAKGVGGVGGTTGALIGIGRFAKSKQDNNDLCNPPKSNKIADGVAGAATGILNIIGLGFLTNPIAPLQTQLSTAQSNLQSVYNSNGLQFAENQEQINQALQEVMSKKGEVLQEMLAINTEITNENLGRVDIALATMGILTLVIVIYLLFSN